MKERTIRLSTPTSTLKQPRCDDLESLPYVLMYFFRGAVLWQGCYQKAEVRPNYGEDRCHGFPNEFSILNCTRALRFDNKPDNSYLRKLFWDLSFCEGF